MTNPTVSVELTDWDCEVLLAHFQHPCSDEGKALIQKLNDARDQIPMRERKAKVQALKDNVAIPSGYDHWIALDCLNDAGWDLVRMEKK
jgi:hypothetical protein